MSSAPIDSYLTHLHSSEDLTTSYEATRAGFVSMALEKNRLATPYVSEARVLQAAALLAESPAELMKMDSLQHGLLVAAGLSDKALTHLSSEDGNAAVRNLIKEFLEPAGEKFVEELVYRFLLTCGDALGGSSRNIGGFWAQQKLTRTIISTLTVAGTNYRWLRSDSREWLTMSQDNADIERYVRGLAWHHGDDDRTLIYNLTIPLVANNVDICLFDLAPELVNAKTNRPESYLALGELKGGIDPAGADEHWKTAESALRRIRTAFSNAGFSPAIFYVGAAIEKRMASEIWTELEDGRLANAANLTNETQVASLARWLCGL